eukprot:gnl/TRDRNA2_/TRDRNA2_162139_c1_seq1.p1 gnl/TRDRNA2_/TRDRNA2_162139_c1~~gnl/TRDRNA2_/TRDRNA2_162139_c1_seq1.p1  ORF type:complete len:108 (-),score=26.57 gnl/TRDRNA2_/TRDRNA2_162139_c1_seq1:50-340(-)
MDSALQKLAASQGVEGTSEELCKNEKIVASVLKDVTEQCKHCKLVDFELPKKIALLPSIDGVPAWTPENDMLTAAMKLKRPIIARAFAAEIDSLYK